MSNVELLVSGPILAFVSDVRSVQSERAAPLTAQYVLQEETFCVLQLTYVYSPELTDCGSAVKVTEGAGVFTTTVTAFIAEPPGPVQVMSNVELLVSAKRTLESVVRSVHNVRAPPFNA